MIGNCIFNFNASRIEVETIDGGMQEHNCT